MFLSYPLKKCFGVNCSTTPKKYQKQHLNYRTLGIVGFGYIKFGACCLGCHRLYRVEGAGAVALGNMRFSEHRHGFRGCDNGGLGVFLR